jgi:hypothetical protein
MVSSILKATSWVDSAADGPGGCTGAEDMADENDHLWFYGLSGILMSWVGTTILEVEPVVSSDGSCRLS